MKVKRLIEMLNDIDNKDSDICVHLTNAGLGYQIMPINAVGQGTDLALLAVPSFHNEDWQEWENE